MSAMVRAQKSGGEFVNGYIVAGSSQGGATNVWGGAVGKEGYIVQLGQTANIRTSTFRNGPCTFIEYMPEEFAFNFVTRNWYARVVHVKFTGTGAIYMSEGGNYTLLFVPAG